jgi:hypothetical protein
VICDSGMPVLNGPDLYREVERRDPGVAGKFVFVVGPPRALRPLERARAAGASAAMMRAGVERAPSVSDDRRLDPVAEAERQLRLALAAEARAERAVRGRIRTGVYGCVTLVVLLFLLAVFFSL